MRGGAGFNRFYGGPRNDLLIGGSGGNAFIFSIGSGRDTISVPVATLSGANSIVFGGSYRPTLGNGSLVIRYGNAGDEVHLEEFDPNDAYGLHRIDTFEFTDVTLTYSQLIDLGFDLTGTNAEDVLTGTNVTDRLEGLDGPDSLSGGPGNDTLTGGRGNDVLMGGGGNEVYVFHLGDGIDTIEDVAAPGEGNRIRFGEGISQADLNLVHNQDTLTIQVGASDDALQLADFDPTNTTGSLVVETLAFADGSEVMLASLLGPTTTEGDDVIVTGAGDQVIDALGGDDTVDAGTGNDTLMGGAGNDAYVFGRGDGRRLLSTQVDQLIQAMVNFSVQSGLTWEQAIAQRPDDVQALLAGS